MVGFTGTVVWDEAGRFDKKKSNEIYYSILPSITIEGNRMYVISTPFGKGNIFYNLCTEDIDDINKGTKLENLITVPKRLIKVPYYEVPHIRERLHIIKANLASSPQGWKMGYELEFGDDALDSLFPYDFLREYAYDSNIDIVAHNLDELLRLDINDEYIHDDKYMLK
jgi:hypothetical protein